MKKTLSAGFLLLTLGLSTIEAKPILNMLPEHVQSAECFWTKTTYVTEKVGKCKITYRVTSCYFFSCLIKQTKCEVKKDCSGDGGN